MEKTKKLGRGRVARAGVMVLLMVVAVSGLWLGVRFALQTSTPFFSVSSRSMESYLKVNDVIIVQGNSFDQVQEGDVIVFHRPGTERTCTLEDRNCIVHRVWEIGFNGDEKYFITKGDANPAPDRWKLFKDDYIGKVVFLIPQLGYFTRILNPPVNYVILAVIVVMIFLIEVSSPEKKMATSNTSTKNSGTV